MNRLMRAERIRRGWTQEFVARQAEITLSAYQKIETGRRQPSYRVLIRLEDLFGMTHRELFAAAPEDADNLS